MIGLSRLRPLLACAALLALSAGWNFGARPELAAIQLRYRMNRIGRSFCGPDQPVIERDLRHVGMKSGAVIKVEIEDAGDRRDHRGELG